MFTLPVVNQEAEARQFLAEGVHEMVSGIYTPMRRRRLSKEDMYFCDSTAIYRSAIAAFRLGAILAPATAPCNPVLVALCECQDSQVVEMAS